MSDFDTELNCEGLNCPLPVLKTKKKIKEMSSGEILKMTSTDPGSVNDVTFWSKINKNYLLSHAEDGGVYTFYIQKNQIYLKLYKKDNFCMVCYTIKLGTESRLYRGAGKTNEYGILTFTGLQ